MSVALVQLPCERQQLACIRYRTVKQRSELNVWGKGMIKEGRQKY